MEETKSKYIWGLLRLGMGWIFLWAFIDKVFGFGFETISGKSWIDGVSPTFGFLKFAVKGPFAGFYQSLAGNVLVDWLFMLGLLFIGLALILGIGVKIAASAGALMLLLMYAAAIPPAHNPFLDEHLMYIFVMFGLIFSKSGRVFGLGNWWSSTALVQKVSFLE